MEERSVVYLHYSTLLLYVKAALHSISGRLGEGASANCTYSRFIAVVVLSPSRWRWRLACCGGRIGLQPDLQASGSTVVNTTQHCAGTILHTIANPLPFPDGECNWLDEL